MIPPALGIPYWRETRPTCVGMTAEETQELTEYEDSRLGCPRHDFVPNSVFYAGILWPWHAMVLVICCMSWGDHR